MSLVLVRGSPLPAEAKDPPPAGDEMNEGQMQRAKRWALANLDRWISVTGVITENGGYHSELEAIIEDAVEIGAGVACGAKYKEIKSRIK